MRWIFVGCGAMRFHGADAMREMMSLLKGDDDYTWSVPTGWPAPFFIDVYPRTLEARDLLIQLVKEND